MSMNKMHSQLLSKIYVAVINTLRTIDSSNRIRYYRPEHDFVRCEVLWTGRGESWADNFSLSENQAMGV